jgi:uncharacterized membrane protein SpoIIM required for sporulation
MTRGTFVRKNRPRWQELEAMIDLMERHSRRTRQRTFLHELSSAYRATAADLAFAQTHFRGSTVLLFLHQLVARAHNQIYRARAVSLKEAVHFVRREIPEATRRHLTAVSWAALIFVTGIMLGLSAIQIDERSAALLVPNQILDSIYSGKMWTGPIMSLLPAPVTSTMLVTNNLTVALLAFVGGLTFGVVSFWILFFNGVMLGMVFKLCAKYGLLGPLAGFVATHGFLEISAVILAGGAGFVMADALLRPGSYSRRDALSVQARAAVRMAVATVPALIVAGCLEAFVSPSTLPIGVKAVVGLALGVCFWLYLLGPARQKTGKTEEAAGKTVPHRAI